VRRKSSRERPTGTSRRTSSFEAIPIHLSDVDLAEAVSLGHEQGIYAYDAYILECARRYAAPLLSLDRAQCEVARTLGIDVLEVES